MKQVELYIPGDRGYDAACTFAQRVYKEDLSFSLTSFPEVLFAITDGDTVCGCMGLNTGIHFPLFRHDHRLARIIKGGGGRTTYGEQSILALRECSVGLPVLISVTAHYALTIGIHKIVYAAIGVSQRTVRGLGFTSREYGPVYLALFPKEERHLYEPWYTLHHPVCCIIDTAGTNLISEAVLNRFARRVTLGSRLRQQFAAIPRYGT